MWVRGSVARRFANEAEGIKALGDWLRGEKVTQVVCEATGGYEDRVVEGLRAGEMAVYVAHPSRVRSFAQALGQGAKTDPLDAQVLALYGEVFEVEGQFEQDSASRELREVVGRRQQLVQQRVQELNRLEKGLRERTRSPVSGMWPGSTRRSRGWTRPCRRWCGVTRG